jgi:hypothetical protein
VVLAWTCFQPESARAADVSSSFAKAGLLKVELTGPVTTAIADRELRKEQP